MRSKQLEAKSCLGVSLLEAFILAAFFEASKLPVDLSRAR